MTTIITEIIFEKIKVLKKNPKWVWDLCNIWTIKQIFELKTKWIRNNNKTAKLLRTEESWRKKSHLVYEINNDLFKLQKS